jgi:hypothetical protein
VSVARASSIVFANPKGQKVDDVYVRFGNSTRKLTPAEMLQYMADWGSSAAAVGEGNETGELATNEQDAVFEEVA